MINDSGERVVRRDFNSFGELNSEVFDPDAVGTFSSDLQNHAESFHLGFTGQYRDAATELQLHGVRWYDAETGRWLSEDPGGFTCNPPQNLTH